MPVKQVNGSTVIESGSVVITSLGGTAWIEAGGLNVHIEVDGSMKPGDFRAAPQGPGIKIEVGPARDTIRSSYTANATFNGTTFDFAFVLHGVCEDEKSVQAIAYTISSRKPGS